MKRTADAHWKGDAKTGQGVLTTQSGVLKDSPYTFNGRFSSVDGKAGTNPEELIGAAHAGCFSMALALAVTEAGFKVDDIMTHASVNIQSKDGHFEISEVALSLKAKIPGIPQSKFEELTKMAKMGCPVSKALAGTKITLSSELMN